MGGVGPQQDQVARRGRQRARRVPEAPAAADGGDQQPIARAVRAPVVVARCLVEVAGDDMDDLGMLALGAFGYGDCC